MHKASAPVAAAPLKPAPKAEKHLPAAKRRQLSQRQELADLSDDYRLLKKLKRGKISEVCGCFAFNACSATMCKTVMYNTGGV